MSPPDKDDNNGDDVPAPYRYGRQRDYGDAIATLKERQRTNMEKIQGHEQRLAAIEKKQTEVDALLNKVLGGIAIITGVGVVLGWAFSIGSNVFKLFH